MTSWHRLSPEEALEQLASNQASGLTAAEVARRLAESGPNQLQESGGRSRLAIFLEQFRSALVALLVGAAVVSFFLGETIDGAAILTIVLLNTALGFFQEHRAERALAALKRYDVPTVRVLRDGLLQEAPADGLVPGDVIHLQSGNLVPADARLLSCVNLRSQEATLTGESEDAEKQIEPITAEDPALGDRTNMVYRSSTLTSGHGVAVVTATGMATELGKIAASLQTVRHAATPLQQKLGRLGRTLAVASLVIVAVVFTMGVWAGEESRLMLMTSLSLAVAIVPEGLPAVATVALAIGALRMYERNALIRRLPAVETLGAVTVICTDKTGTLTENRMAVSEVVVAGERLSLLERAPDSPTSREPPRASPAVDLLMTAVALCNNAEIYDGGDQPAASVVGQPTETALAEAAARFGKRKPALLERFQQLGEAPFDSARKRMTTLHLAEPSPQPGPTDALLADAGAVVFTKGAAEMVLRQCSREVRGSETHPLDQPRREELQRTIEGLASEGFRVLGVAFRPFPQPPPEASPEDLEQDLTLLGLVALVDPPRPEARRAVERCREAGIRPVMITGDHPMTARYIAEQVGIEAGDAPIGGAELTRMTDDELRDRVEGVSLFARVAPTDKLRIVQALQDQGHVVAMTGDGVNDAPALKRAHIGVAMGLTGADVSKDASDMVLLDDHFATIVNAVEQGRIVYDNIRKFVRYTLTSNAGEVGVMALGPLLGTPLPLLPLQILWVNLVTDGLPGLALAFEPQEHATMRRPPRPPKEQIIDRGMWADILWVGLLMACLALATAWWLGGPSSAGEAHWRTVVFTVLTLAQMGNVLALRSSRDSLFRIGLLSNTRLLAAVGLTLMLQAAVLYAPPLQRVFATTPLTMTELAICAAVGSLVFWAIEAKKLVLRVKKAV